MDFTDSNAFRSLLLYILFEIVLSFALYDFFHVVDNLL